MKTREELENLINGSPLFSIDRYNDAELFVAEERRFINDLAELMSLVRQNDFAEIGYEIIKTVKACIKAYKIENGAFLNYFNSALKRTILVAKAKEMTEVMRGGFTLDEKTEYTIRQILKLAKVRGDDINDSGFQKRAAAVMNIPITVVIEAIAINDAIAVRSGNDKITNKDGGEEDNELFSFIAAVIDTAEDALIKFESMREIVVSIDTVFRGQQERIKPLLAKLLTARLLDAINEIQLIEEVMPGMAFIDDDIYLRYKQNNTVPTAREIAEAHGVMEASASRTLKKFLEKVKINR
jgi:hypothetical protein